MDKQKIILAAAIVLAGAMLSVSYYVVQKSQQHSLEREWAIDTVFDKRIKCKNIATDLSKQFNNVASVYYSESTNTCIVKYFDGSTTKELPIQDFQANR